jgi:hypothetical protein
VLWNGHDKVTSLDNDLRRVVGGWSNSIGGYASPSFASELVLDRVRGRDQSRHTLRNGHRATSWFARSPEGPLLATLPPEG